MADIYMVNSNQGITQKIILLNQMIVQLAGLVAQGTFNKNELDSIYSNAFMSREYLRNQGIGNTLSTYTGWTSISTQLGYNIWQYTPTNYSYSVNNQVYFNGQLFTNRGLAYSQSTTTFNNVLLYEADSHPGYVFDTSNAGDVGTNTSFYVNASTVDYLYLGSNSTFGGFNVNWKTRGGGYTLVYQYWTGTAWVNLGPSNNLVDDTNSWQSNGVVTWTPPLNWNTTTVNSISNYWIRVYTTTNPVLVGNAYYIIPCTSVTALLALSSSDVQDDNWCWCSFGNSIYVTLPNTGGFAGGGNTFILGNDTTANLQNFFIYNNPITADYMSALYNPVEQITTATYMISPTDTVMLVYATHPTTLTLPSAVGMEGKQYFIKHVAGGSSVTLYGASGNLIDGNSSLDMSYIGAYYTVQSDGENWWIINGPGEGAWTTLVGTSTVSGWASFTTELIYYKKVGKTVFVEFDIEGTSNATTASFTLPFASSNTVQTLEGGFTVDNGTAQSTGGAIVLPANSSTVSLWKDMTQSNAWTASGTKKAIGQVQYQSAI